MIKVIAKPRHRRSKPSAIQIFPRNPRDVTCLSLHPHISRIQSVSCPLERVYDMKGIDPVTCGGGTSFDGQLSTRAGVPILFPGAEEGVGGEKFGDDY